MEPEYNRLLLTAMKTSVEAGRAILSMYESDLHVEIKSDDSPLTLADRESHEIINRNLRGDPAAAEFPVLSEEGSAVSWEVRRKWDCFWLVDPLDGTKEFIKRNGEFTVNIALIRHNRPVLGIVFVPINGALYFSADSTGAYRLNITQDNVSEVDTLLLAGDLSGILDISRKLPCESQGKRPASACTVVISRSHSNTETDNYLADLEKKYDEIAVVNAGSSLKLCLVAEGKADIYPRLGPTMEWDTAAAHAVVNGAGRLVTNFGATTELTYNKQDLRNPWFIVA